MRAGRCLNGTKGFYEQIKVGPLDNDEAKFSWERIAKPVQTSCGGYSVEGIFGRRRLGATNDAAFQDLLRESFGFGFATAACMYGEEQCLKLGGVAVEHPSESQRKLMQEPADGVIWVGLKRPSGEPVPFYYQLKTSDVGGGLPQDLDPHEIPRRLDSIDWLHAPHPVWYNGETYNDIDDLIHAYASNKLEKVTPRILAAKHEESQKEAAVRRRLAPGPFPGAAGTAGQDLDRTRKRAGLEFR